VPWIIARPASELFPGPESDRFLKLLEGLTSRIAANPLHIEEALQLPHYVESYVAESGGEDFTRGLITNRPDPVLLFHIIGNPLESIAADSVFDLNGRHFDVLNATPIILETPLWSLMPQLESGWIQSALPHDIAPKIATRGTDSVYVEVSALDREFKSGAYSSPGRGVWLVRDAEDYAVTIFGPGRDGGGFLRVRFRYDAELGCFVQFGLPSACATTRSLLRVESLTSDAMRTLFIVLMILRDLSPGPKPPPFHGIGIGGVWFTRSPFEPPLATPHAESVGCTEYIIPRSLDGTVYKGDRYSPHFSGPADIDDEAVADMLDRHVDVIKDDVYIVEMTKILADLYCRRGMLTRANDILEQACSAAARAERHWDQWLLEANRGMVLLGLGRENAAQEAFYQSIRINMGHRSSGGDKADPEFDEVVQRYLSSGGDAKKIRVLLERSAVVDATQSAEPSAAKLKTVIMYPLKQTQPKVLLSFAIQHFSRLFPGAFKESEMFENIVVLSVEASSRDDALQYNTEFGNILRRVGILAEEHEVAEGRATTSE